MLTLSHGSAEAERRLLSKAHAKLAKRIDYNEYFGNRGERHSRGRSKRGVGEASDGTAEQRVAGEQDGGRMRERVTVDPGQRWFEKAQATFLVGRASHSAAAAASAAPPLPLERMTPCFVGLGLHMHMYMLHATRTYIQSPIRSLFA